MALPQEAHAQRQLGQPGDPVLDGCDVVAHLLQVGRGCGVHGVGLEHVREAGLRPLDPAAGHGLAREVRRHQEVGGRKQPAGSGEASEGCISVGQRQDCSSVERECPREGLRPEGDVAELPARAVGPAPVGRDEPGGLLPVNLQPNGPSACWSRADHQRCLQPGAGRPVVRRVVPSVLAGPRPTRPGRASTPSAAGDPSRSAVDHALHVLRVALAGDLDRGGGPVDPRRGRRPSARRGPHRAPPGARPAGCRGSARSRAAGRAATPARPAPR